LQNTGFRACCYRQPHHGSRAMSVELEGF